MKRDLGFARILPGQEKWPWNLFIFLHKNSLSAQKAVRHTLIEEGAFGKPRLKRQPLLKRIHGVLEADLAKGGSFATLDTRIRSFLFFYKYCDDHDIDPTTAIKSLLAIFQQWVAHEAKTSEASGMTLYYRVNNVATILARALNMPIRRFMVAAGITEPPRTKEPVKPKTYAQELGRVTTFVQHVVELAQGITTEAIRSSKPITIHFSSGKEATLYGGRWTPERMIKFGRPDPDLLTWKSRERLFPSSKPFDHSPLINLRIEAELLHFIAQTGMNLSQALSYPVGDFCYSSYLNGYQVRRRYKGRRQGEVEFNIYSEYRLHFESYLRWRKENLAAPDDGRLFPFVLNKIIQINLDKRRSFNSRHVFTAIGVSFVGPHALRKIRANFLDRNLQDPQIAADMSQHSLRTLQQNYRMKDHQRAMAEITTFWKKADPSLQPPAPGKCVDGRPKPSPAPRQSPTPDCIGPGGCFFCLNHRDVKSFDYAWSLASYRHLKTLELASQRVASDDSHQSPAQVVILRITQKLRAMRTLSQQCERWVKEALLRIREERFHPDWEGLIAASEAA